MYTQVEENKRKAQVLLQAGRHSMDAALGKMAKAMKSGQVDLTGENDPDPNPKKRLRGNRLGKAKVIASALEPLAMAMTAHTVFNVFMFVLLAQIHLVCSN